MEPVERLHQRVQGTGANSSVQGDGEAGGFPAVGPAFVNLNNIVEYGPDALLLVLAAKVDEEANGPCSGYRPWRFIYQAAGGQRVRRVVRRWGAAQGSGSASDEDTLTASLTSETGIDPSRKFPATPDRPEAPGRQGSRPLQTLIWYPALQSSSKPMTVGDYVALADREIHFDTPDQEHNKWRRRLKSSFDISLWAVRDAKPVERRYPVVIYAPSDSSIAWENADLCEYLASHGYVVLASSFNGTVNARYD